MNFNQIYLLLLYPYLNFWYGTFVDLYFNQYCLIKLSLKWEILDQNNILYRTTAEEKYLNHIFFFLELLWNDWK